MEVECRGIAIIRQMNDNETSEVWLKLGKVKLLTEVLIVYWALKWTEILKKKENKLITFSHNKIAKGR